MPVYDTYAWIEYFRGSEKGAIVKRLLESQEGSTPSIVLAEVARKYRREGFNEDDILKRLLFIVGKTEVVTIDIEISLKASEIYLELLELSKKLRLRTPSLADAIVYSIAMLKQDKLVTGDKLFRNMENVIYIGD
ncbi:MAG: PIN domain-containing protein [Desulfurococcales archaeon]|nr:PIN domain-containing protein [Desulfurococcales archaeon]